MKGLVVQEEAGVGMEMKKQHFRRVYERHICEVTIVNALCLCNVFHVCEGVLIETLLML